VKILACVGGATVADHRTDDLNALVVELNATSSGPASTDQLSQLLRHIVASHASDLFLVAGASAAYRIAGSVQQNGGAVLDDADIEAIVLPALPPHAQQQWRDRHAVDASLSIPGVGRFRINLHRERGRAAAAIRLLPAAIPSLADLHLPSELDILTSLGPGLVLIGGATGSGKTTTLASLIDMINRRDHKHIITIEDPIEYEHHHHGSVVEQIEVGVDAPDFATALRSAVRQAPDVIVVGEMRDPETMQIAVAAAETGHVVFSTLHTTDVVSTIGRICDSFPVERQPTIRQELAMALSAVMTQRFIARVGGGRVPACELLVVGYGARQHIRKNALQHLHQEITISRKQGSFTLEEQLHKMVVAGVITRADAVARAGHPDELERLIGT
jgi:twitching motility protein PilT